MLTLELGPASKSSPAYKELPGEVSCQRSLTASCDTASEGALWCSGSNRSHQTYRISSVFSKPPCLTCGCAAMEVHEVGMRSQCISVTATTASASMISRRDTNSQMAANSKCPRIPHCRHGCRLCNRGNEKLRHEFTLT